MAQFTTTYDPVDPMAGSTGNYETDKANAWANTANNFLNVLGKGSSIVDGIVSIFQRNDLEDAQKQYATQQYINAYQQEEQRKRTNTIIIAGAICLFSVIATLYVTKK